MPIYSIDLTHYLGDTGLIEPKRGPARKMAEFLTAVVAHASDFDRPEEIPGPVCFKCRKRDKHIVDTGINDDWAVVWQCLACDTQGRITSAGLAQRSGPGSGSAFTCRTRAAA